MSEEVNIDVAALLAAAVEVAGGRVEIPVSVLANLDPEKVALALDQNDDGSVVILSLVDASEVNYDE